MGRLIAGGGGTRLGRGGCSHRLRQEFVESADGKAHAEEAAGGAGVSEVVAVVGAGVVKLARVTEPADRAHEVEIGFEELGVNARDHGVEQPGRQVERTDEHSAGELLGREIVEGAVTAREGGHRQECTRGARAGATAT